MRKIMKKMRKETGLEEKCLETERDMETLRERRETGG